VLQRPRAIALQLAAPQPLFAPGFVRREAAPSAPPPPWTVPGRDPAPSTGSLREGSNLLVVLASVLLGGAMAMAGVAGVSPEVGSGEPVGIALHTPKTLDRAIRTRDRIGGFSPRLDAVTVSIDSLARSRHQRRRF
jgi:hypothetical protein